MEFQKRVFAFLFLSLTAHAGVDTSGGGNTVVCFDSAQTRQSVYEAFQRNESSGINAVNPFTDEAVLKSIVSVESLDLYMHHLPRGQNQNEFLSTVTVPSDLNAQQVFSFLLNRIMTRNSLPLIIQEKANKLTWIAADGVARIADTGLPVLFAPNCLVAQTAHRKGSQIFFDRHLISKVDSFNQAILSVHEALYAVAKDDGAEDALQIYELISLFIRADQALDQIGNEALAREFVRLLFKDEDKFLTIPCQSQFAGVPVFLANKVNLSPVVETIIWDKPILNVYGFELQLMPFGQVVRGCVPDLNRELIRKDSGLAAAITIGSDLPETVGLGWVFLSNDPTGDHGTRGKLNDNAYISFPASDYRISLKVNQGAMLQLRENSIELKHAQIEVVLRTGKKAKLSQVTLGNYGKEITSGILAEDYSEGSFFRRKHYKAESKVEFDKHGEIHLAK